VLRISETGYPLPVKFLRDLALIIVRRRVSTFQIPATDDDERTSSIKRPRTPLVNGIISTKPLKRLANTLSFCYIHLSIMKTSTIVLLGVSLLTSNVLGKLSYIAKMTHHGIEVPVEFTPLPALRNGPEKSPHRKRQSISNTANWAGAIQEVPSSALFHTVSANWEVPSISTPAGQTLGTTAYWLYEWVGIDSSCDVILQAGTEAYVS